MIRYAVVTTVCSTVMITSQDKLRMLRVKAEESKLSAQQAKEVAALFKFADPQHEACMVLYGAVDDKQAFVDVTLTALKFKDGMQWL